jgi:hypothetical protein
LAKIFNKNLDQVTLPSSLQSLTFGQNFNQSLERATPPSNLGSLTFGMNYCIKSWKKRLTAYKLPGGRICTLSKLWMGCNHMGAGGWVHAVEIWGTTIWKYDSIFCDQYATYYSKHI